MSAPAPTPYKCQDLLQQRRKRMRLKTVGLLRKDYLMSPRRRLHPCWRPPLPLEALLMMICLLEYLSFNAHWLRKLQNPPPRCAAYPTYCTPPAARPRPQPHAVASPR